MSETKLSHIHYSPKGYWKGLGAIQKLAEAGRKSNKVARDWLQNKLFGRFICQPLATFLGLSLMFPHRAKFTKPTSFSGPTTLWGGGGDVQGSYSDCRRLSTYFNRGPLRWLELLQVDPGR